MPTLPLSGGCNCGAVRFALAAPPVGASYCHCRRCQRRTGTAASINASTEPGSFRIITGEDALRAWKPDDGFEKWFCGECGSALFSKHPDDPDRLGVRMGAFDDDPGVRPTHHQFVAYAPPWAPIPDDGLPRYPEGTPK
jgi:hypothetical protein